MMGRDGKSWETCKTNTVNRQLTVQQSGIKCDQASQRVMSRVYIGGWGNLRKTQDQVSPIKYNPVKLRKFQTLGTDNKIPQKSIRNF